MVALLADASASGVPLILGCTEPGEPTPGHDAEGTYGRMLDRHWRAGVERGLQPVGDRLRQIGVTPDQLTAFGLLASAATAVRSAPDTSSRVSSGSRSAASATCSTAPSRAAPGRPRRGARSSTRSPTASPTSLLLGGVAWYLAPRNPHLPVLVLAVAGLSMVISYERAKAESLGLQARGGLMERAERFVFLGIGCRVRHPRARPVGHARPHRDDRGAALRHRVAPGRPAGAPAARPSRVTPRAPTVRLTADRRWFTATALVVGDPSSA